LEASDLAEYASEFEDPLDPASLGDLVTDLLDQVKREDGGSSSRLIDELMLLQRLADDGSGVKPAEED